MREAGLPAWTSDVYGDRALFSGSKGVVRAVHPAQWRVDIETEEGSFLTDVLVIGPYFPELHADGDSPSHVGYFYVRGMPDALCWPMPHRRLLGPTDEIKGQEGQSQPERRYYALHNFIFRSGEITWRITKDHRFVLESESGDYIQYDTQRREFRVHGPTVFIGTEQETRIEYEQDDVVRIVMPKILMGDQALPDQDGYTYVKDELVHIMSNVVRLTGQTSIILEAPHIYGGSSLAAQRMILGNLFQEYTNTVVKPMIDAHVHGNVQNGPSVSGAPTTPYPAMPDSTLSIIGKLSE